MSYAGDISCKDCWEMLESNPDAHLIDVRTTAEWSFVGIPVLEKLGKSPILLEWQQYPSMLVNPEFVTAAATMLEAAGAKKNSRVFTLCRSGMRSIAAAESLTSAGFENAYNILDGFEGNPDEAGHRATLGGWKFEGLPWMQK
ncbi:MAG: rhodanese-like domain-containing protein [Rhizobiaceae bacterium]